MRTPSMGIDQNQEALFMDKYWGRCPQFLHQIPEAYIYICNPDYLWLLQSRVNDTLVVENISVELLRELDEVLYLMCYVDPYDLFVDFTEVRKNSFDAILPAKCEPILSCSQSFDVTCKTIPADLPLTKFKICKDAMIDCTFDVCSTPYIECYDPVRAPAKCDMKMSCKDKVTMNSRDMLDCWEVTGETEIDCLDVYPCVLDIRIIALAQCINREYNMIVQYKDVAASMIQYKHNT